MPTKISGVVLSDLQLFLFNLVKNYKLISAEEITCRNSQLPYSQVENSLSFLEKNHVIRRVSSFPNRYSVNPNYANNTNTTVSAE